MAALAVLAAVALASCAQQPTTSGAPGGQQTGASGQATPDQALLALAHRSKDDPLALGKVDAPVVMIEWSDFQCPFCGKYSRETEPILIKDYVDKGLLRIEWRDFPYFGKQSVQAAKAARAAGRQGKFWQFHDEIYERELPPNSGKLTDEFLVSVAKDVGLDVDRFRQDMADPDVAKAVDADYSEAQKLGISGTPTFLVNGKPAVGAQPIDTFRTMIEDAAKAAS